MWRYRPAGVEQTGADGAGGVFSNDPDFTVGSQFNKEKWLPLCREAPFRISHYCCQVMKKSPIGKYQRKNHYKPILATMTEESRIRKQAWIRHGCNAFNASKQTSQPMSFWTEQDVLQYIEDFGLEIAPVYGQIVSETKDHQIGIDSLVKGCRLKCTGCNRTGCIFCGFGFHLEKDGETRFQRLKKTHPKLYDYCMNGGEWMDNPDYDPDYDGTPDGMGWVDWNPPKLWIPSRDGLGMRFVFDKVNEIYGKQIYRYE